MDVRSGAALGAVLGVLASVAVATASAQDDTTGGGSAPETTETTPKLSYIGALGSYVDLDKDRLPKDGTGVGVYFGRQIGNGNFFWEAQAFTQILETDRNDLTDFYRSGGGLDLVYSLGKRRGFSPFLLIGGGGNYNDVVPDHSDKFNAYGNAGLGFVTRPYGYYGFRFRAEARYVYDDFQGGANDFRYSAGIELPLSPYNQPPRDVVVPPPAAEPVEVVRTETLADSDGDGVPDTFDKCPGTPKGMPVDGVGCGLSQVITLTGVTFDFNKATLTPDARKILEDVALKIAHFTDVPMELGGHTDSVGSDSYNLKLSQLRADSVRNFLIEQNVPGAKLTAKGYGESKPVADNGTDAGRALNRRVELSIAGQTPPSVAVDAAGNALPGGAAESAPAPPTTPEAPAAEAPAEGAQ